MKDKNALGAVSATEGDAVPCSAPAPELPHVDPHANCRAELDRMRLLLKRASEKHKSYRVEMEPAAKGFAIVVTGVTAEDEWRFAHEVSQYLKVMFEGSLRFMHAYAMTTVDSKSVAGAAKLQAEFIDAQIPEAEDRT